MSSFTDETKAINLQLACTRCGALLKFKPGTRHLACEYCGAQNEIAQPAESGEKIEETSLDDFLAKLTGPVAFQPVRTPGDYIRKGELLALLTSHGKHLRVCSPVSGQIVEGNPEILEDSVQLTLDPFGKVWLFKLKPTQWTDETNSYYLGEKATEWVSQEIDRFKNWLSGSMTEPNRLYAGVVMQDGGELIDQPLSELPAEAWKEFQEKFLTE